MLEIRIANVTQDQTWKHAFGPLEFGRGVQRENIPRFILADEYASRNHLRIEELPDGQVRINNLSATKQILFGDGSSLSIGESQIVETPVRLRVGATTIWLAQDGVEEVSGLAMRTISPEPATIGRSIDQNVLNDLGESPAPEVLTRWLETVITLHRSVTDAQEFYDRTADALVDLIGLDLGMVLLRRDDQWRVVASRRANQTIKISYSHTILKQVATQKQTIYQDLEILGKDITHSLIGVRALVVSPILGPNDEAIGALYGLRSMRSLVRGGRIATLEAQVIQLLAAAVGANLTRATAIRTRAQFEQFFSSELVRELERNPALLAGKSQEVTILVSDLRGFTHLSGQLSPQVSCLLLQDLMERLSEQIVRYDGVIVDYAGDGILAMWNAPVQQNDHASLAGRAALAMRDEMAPFNAKWQDKIGQTLRLGIGLNTGLAHVGNTGSKRKFKYGPHGYSVNLASRVQDATKRYNASLLITSSTHDQLSDRFITSHVGRLEASGVTQEVELYELHNDLDNRRTLPD